MSAMRISNMANTFHFLDPDIDMNSNIIVSNNNNTQVQVNNTSSEPCSPTGSAPNTTVDKRHYLQSECSIREHSIWRKPGFWVSALRESVLTELQRSPAVHWDELTPEELREAVIGMNYTIQQPLPRNYSFSYVLAVHNIIFGQLGSLSFVMQQQGLPAEKVNSGRIFP
jgi:hypothetical protein